MKKISLSIIVLLAFLAAPALAQRQQGELIYKLRVTPMAPGRPALKYRLLPSLADQTPGNAAQLYMLGATQAPTNDQLNTKFSSWQDMDVAALPREEIERTFNTGNIHYIFSFFDAAARKEECSWGTTFKTEGYDALLPHLIGMRNGTRLIAVRTRLQIADGDFNRAIRNLQTGFSAALQLNNDAVLVQQLVSAALARWMLDDVREWVGRENSPNLYWALAGLPRPFNDSRQAMDYERFSMTFSFPGLRDLEKGITPEQWQEVMQKLPEMLKWDGGKSDIAKTAALGPTVLMVKLYPQAKKYFIERGLTKEKVEAMPVQQILARYLVESFQEECDEVLKWHSLPFWQAREPMIAAEKAAKQAQAKGEMGPMGWMVPSVVSNARLKLVLVDRMISSLQCVEGIRAYAANHEGRFPDSLTDLVDTPAPLDPVTNQPFGYMLKGDGATLSAPPVDGLNDRGWKFEITLAR